MPGGDYVFELMGSNNSGVWSEKPIRLDIHVDTPFFQSKIFYAGLIALLLFFAYAVYRYRIQQIREKAKIRSDYNAKLAELEMSALRAQMNPHFVFNSLNSINKYILTNESRLASRYLSKFSQLMRLILNHSKVQEVTLEDELEAVSLYIELEQLRFENKFVFEKKIHLISNPASILIPPMLIQPFIENSIWHGLMPLDKTGILQLEIYENKNLLQCIVTDNGIGRSKSATLNKNNALRKKSMGMKITSDRIKLVNALHSTKADIEIHDLVHENIPCGTQVKISLPIKYIAKEFSHAKNESNHH